MMLKFREGLEKFEISASLKLIYDQLLKNPPYLGLIQKETWRNIMRKEIF